MGGNKRALVQTDGHKDQTTLFHCPYQNHVYSGPRSLAVPQSAGIVADDFGSPSLTLCANSCSYWLVPEQGGSFVSSLAFVKETKRDTVTASYDLSPIITLWCVSQRRCFPFATPHFEKDHIEF